MIKPNSFKRRLLHAAVQDNVNIIQDNWPALMTRNRVHRSAGLSRGVVLVIACALLPLLYAVSTVSKTPRELVASTPLSPHLTTNRLPQLTANLAATPAAEAASASTTLHRPPSSADRVVDGVASASSVPAEWIDPETLMPVPHSVDLSAFALSVKKIVIDPGHGGDDPGAVTAGGLTEKDLALDIGLRLRDLLKAASFAVRMTREEDQTVPLAQRVIFANQTKSDLFVSIHLNWVEPHRARVVETYYLGPTEDSATLHLAGLENTHSGYSLADFRRLLEGVYTDMKRGESRRFAEAVQSELVRALQTVNPVLSDKAVKTAPFVVLVGTEMPAILAEVACLSNVADARLLASAEYRQTIAQALFAGVRTYATTLYQANVTRKDIAS